MSQQDSLAEQCEAGPAKHLALEHPDPVDVSLNDAGAPGQGESGDDRVAVSVDAGRESVEAGQVVLTDGVEPLRQPFALALWAKDRT